MGKNWGAVDHLLLTGAGKPLALFRCVRCVPTTTMDRESVRDELGEHLPATNHSFNPVIGYEAEYECTVRDEIEAGDIEIDVGVQDEALEITRIVIVETNNKYARIQVEAHEHPHTSNGHAVDNFGEHLDSERTISLPAFLGFGAKDFLAVFTELDVQSSRYTITIGHDDAQNNVGGHLVGRSFGEEHQAEVEAITDTVPNDPASPWKVTNKSAPKVNTDHYRVSMSATKLIAGPV
jgi:hypothetical protein